MDIKNICRLFIIGSFLLVACLQTSGCALTGTALTTTGYDSEPHMVWNGTHFGIVYYHRAQSHNLPQINVIKIDKDANIISQNNGVGSISHLYTPYYLSDLVWNSDNNQFAFAYTKDKVIHFIRLDANLNLIGTPLVIKFHIPVDSMEHPTLTDLSLVWNHKRSEYGLSFVTKEHPYLQERHDDIYFSRISPNGTYVGTYQRYRLVNCPGDCEKTSLAYNTTNGTYALSYMKNDFPQHHVMISLYTPGSNLNTHALMTGWAPGWGRETRIIYDPRTDEYVVTALKNAASGSGHELGYQIVRANGTPNGAHHVLTHGQGFDKITSLSNFLSPVQRRHLVCASAQPQIHCKIATETGFVSSDFAYTSSNEKSWHPSVSIGDVTYVAWIQNGRLHFGSTKKK